MTAVAADPWASAYTIFDILNEPDSHGLTWQASNGHPGVGDLYHEVMTTGYSINPSALLHTLRQVPAVPPTQRNCSIETIASADAIASGSALWLSWRVAARHNAGSPEAQSCAMGNL